MNNTIADIGNNDLKNAATVLYRVSLVLKNLPTTPADSDTKTALYESAKLTIRAVRIVLRDVLGSLEHIEATEGLIQ
jgi:hypothetical protein